MVPGPSSEVPHETLEGLLAELPEMEVLGLLPGSSNYTFLARLGPHGENGLHAVYKPARGETPLWDFPAGSLYRREVAAYRLSRALGWPRIPPTVLRIDAPHGPGAVQLFIEADGRHFLSERPAHQQAWREAALFDVLSNNADRKSGHCLFDSRDRVWFIDHGLTFNVEPKLRTVIWDFAGEPLPGDLCSGVEVALRGLGGELGEALGELLEPVEMKLLKRRLRGVLDPDWRFPGPTSGWSVPWPPI